MSVQMGGKSRPATPRKRRSGTIAELERDLQPPKGGTGIPWDILGKGVGIAVPAAGAWAAIIAGGSPVVQQTGWLVLGVDGAVAAGWVLYALARDATHHKVLAERIKQRRNDPKMSDVNAGSGAVGGERGLAQTPRFAPGTIVRNCHYPLSAERRGSILADDYGVRAIAPVQDAFGDEWPAFQARVAEAPGYKRAFAALMRLVDATTIRLEWAEWHDGPGDTSKTCKVWLPDRTARSYGGDPGRWNLMFRVSGPPEPGVDEVPPDDLATAVHSMAAPIERIRPAVARIIAELPDGKVSQGTAVVINGDGVLLTASHVVNSAESIHVRFADGTTVAGRLLGADVEADLALVKVPVIKDLTIAAVGDSTILRPGDDVLLLGYGSAASQEVLEAATQSGHVSAVFLSGGFTYIQTDSACNPGDSGGPLVNVNREVVGIAVSRREHAQDGRVIQGVAFAIASHDVVRVVERLISDYGS